MSTRRDIIVEATHLRKAAPHYKALELVKVKPRVIFRRGRLVVMHGSKHKSTPARMLRLLSSMKYRAEMPSNEDVEVFE